MNSNFICFLSENYVIGNKQYTLYEYCILLQKYKYIKKYCHNILKLASTYDVENYFDYCK